MTVQNITRLLEAIVISRRISRIGENDFMKTDIKISVIIPIYNCQKYLSECLQSLSEQNISDFEVILVDDGSIDNSLKICEMYSRNKENVKVIHTNNNGVSAARNIGLKNAKGELITFIDADDVLDNNYLEILSHSIEIFNADLACCRYRFLPSTIDSITDDKIKSMNASDFSIEVLNNIEIGGYLWNKMFKKEIIDKIQLTFPEGISVWEDKYFVLTYLNLCNKIVHINRFLYNYRQHENSAVRVMNYTKQKHKVWVDEQLIQEICFPRTVEVLKNECFRLMIDCGIIGKKSAEFTAKDRKKMISSIIQNKGYKYLNVKRKLIFLYLSLNIF